MAGEGARGTLREASRSWTPESTGGRGACCDVPEPSPMARVGWPGLEEGQASGSVAPETGVWSGVGFGPGVAADGVGMT